MRNNAKGIGRSKIKPHEGIRAGAWGLGLVGTVLEMFPLTAPLGFGLSLSSDVYSSSLDFQEYGQKQAAANTATRIATSILNRFTGNAIDKSGLDKNIKHLQKFAAGQGVDQAKDQAIEENNKSEE